MIELVLTLMTIKHNESPLDIIEELKNCGCIEINKEVLLNQFTKTMQFISL